MTALPALLLALSCASEAPSAAPVAEPSTEAPAPAEPSRRTAFVHGLPHVRQKPDFCGEACLAMAMTGLGQPTEQDAVFDLTGLDPALGRGAYARDLVIAARALGFEPGQVFYPTEEADLAARSAELDALIGDLARGVPSVVCMHFDASPDASEHFRLVTGYDAETDELRYHDPALDHGADLRMSRAKFLALWPLRADDHTLTLIRLRLDPVALRAPPAATGPTAADLAQAVMAARLMTATSPGFTIRVSPPWVVVGDGKAADVAWRAENTVKWTTTQLRRDFFPRDPDRVWTIWLFDTDASYTDHSVAFFGNDPDTPYGYADGDAAALVMNISTGGGTLVHEMVHPYVAANLPDCPSWMNEGLASLYEHVGEEDGHIWGYTNWRLPGLKRGIKDGDLPSLRWLTSATPEQFYGEEGGQNYAMSRYLMQYLQSKGLLRPFFASYAKNRSTDPTGYQTLLDTLGVTDVPSFLETWQRWALALR